MFEVWLQMSDTNIDAENPSDLPALLLGLCMGAGGAGGGGGGCCA